MAVFSWPGACARRLPAAPGSLSPCVFAHVVPFSPSPCWPMKACLLPGFKASFFLSKSLSDTAWSPGLGMARCPSPVTALFCSLRPLIASHPCPRPNWEPGTTPSLEPASGQGHWDQVYARQSERSRKRSSLLPRRRNIRSHQQEYPFSPSPLPHSLPGCLTTCLLPREPGPPAH